MIAHWKRLVEAAIDPRCLALDDHDGKTAAPLGVFLAGGHETGYRSGRSGSTTHSVVTFRPVSESLVRSTLCAE